MKKALKWTIISFIVSYVLARIGFFLAGVQAGVLDCFIVTFLIQLSAVTMFLLYCVIFDSLD